MYRTRGSMMILGVVLTIVLVIVGVFIYKMMGTVGGAKETQNLTDAGALNVSKQALTTLSTPLQSGIEQQNFASLADNGNVDLKVYNRMIAKALLVGLNANAEQQIWNSTQLPQPGFTTGFTSISATANAQQLINAVQGSSNSISQRLTTVLSNNLNAMPNFLNVAQSDSLRMLGTGATPAYQSSAYAVSCMNPGNNTNVYLDPSILPSGTSLSPQALGTNSSAGLPYLTGYTSLDTGIPGCTLEGTPVNPGAQPHLVSVRDFSAGTSLAKASQTGTSPVVPPNAFQVACKANNASKSVLMTAYSLVGTMGSAYQASIPDGYIKIYSSPNGQPTTIGGWLQFTGAWGDFDVQMYQRAREIAPQFPALTQAYIDNLLNNTTIQPGQTLYLYLNPQTNQQSTNPVVISANQPPYFGTEPPADGPYNHYCPNTTNHAVWYLSSGYDNKLGTLIIWSGEVIDSNLLSNAS